MTDDPQLLALVENFKASLTSTDLASHRDAFENILFKWFGVDGINPGSMDYVDARVFKAFDTMQTRTSAPPSQASGDTMQAAWDGFVNTTLLKCAAQIPSSELVEAFYLSLDCLKQLQNAGTNLDTLTVAQIEAQIRPFFDAGSSYARNHPLKALGLDYDFDQDILKGKMGATLEGLVAGIPTNPAQQQSYWNNQLLMFDGIARTDLAIGATAAQVQNKIVGTSSSQTLNGSASHDIILGEGGNDVLNGGDGDDILFGGTGNDTLAGGTGQNTYYWNAGFGNDVVINENSWTSVWEMNTLIIGKAIDPDTVIVGSSGDNVTLRDPVTLNTVTSQGQLSPIDIMEISRIPFENGEVWEGNEIEDQIIAAGITSGNDNIVGLYRDNAIEADSAT
jgi:hemolysin type calcium-binding protein